MTSAELTLPDAGVRQRVDTILAAPAELLLPERLLLYSLVRALRPQRCLEIGTHFGGSSAIICAALDDVGEGTLVCVDPAPALSPEIWAALAHRTTMVCKPSPGALEEAAGRAGGSFDFAFIDGDHSRAGVSRDIDGVIDLAAPGAYLLLHDSHSPKIAGGIDDCLRRHHGCLVDCGTLSTLSTAPFTAPDGTTPVWGGLRLLRLAASRAESDTR